MKTYQITVRQLVMLAFVTSIFAASAVIFYDRVGGALLGRLAGARVEEQITKTSRTPVAGITDPSVATDERNNQEVYNAISPGVVADFTRARA